MRILILATALLAGCGERIDNDAAQPPVATTEPLTPAGSPAALPGIDAPVTEPGPNVPAPAGPPQTPPTPPETPLAAFSLPMRLNGTEPFWGGRIAADAITISGADRADARFPYVQPVVTGTGARWRTQSTGALPLEVTIVRETCSDGMSDKVYPFEATVVIGKETLKGCAIREADWGGER